MSTDHDADELGSTRVVAALRSSMQDVTMSTPVERIESMGRRRVWGRRVVGTVATTTAVASVLVGSQLYGNPTAPPQSIVPVGQPVHIVTAAYSVDSQADGTVKVLWDKSRYFSDSAGLAAALHKAGFPVLMKVGTFCKGPQDDGRVPDTGVGVGVKAVMKGTTGPDGRVTFTFTPSAMPAGKQLFIGFLNADQLAVTHGRPGSIERLVTTSGNLTCSSTVPPITG